MSIAKSIAAAFAVALMGVGTPALAANDAAAAVETAAATLARNQFVWNDPGGTEPVRIPIRIVVNIGEQRAYVYRGEVLIAATTVSTGKGDKVTPSGSFMILQKAIDHRSSLYNSAPMPFMQRLTWDGVAIHAGKNPGYAASHGCVRVPLAFAKKLYGITTVGTEVTVIGPDGEVAPTTPAIDPSSETAAANQPGTQLAVK